MTMKKSEIFLYRQFQIVKLSANLSFNVTSRYVQQQNVSAEMPPGFVVPNYPHPLITATCT